MGELENPGQLLVSRGFLTVSEGSPDTEMHRKNEATRELISYS